MIGSKNRWIRLLSMLNKKQMAILTLTVCPHAVWAPIFHARSMPEGRYRACGGVLQKVYTLNSRRDFIWDTALGSIVNYVGGTSGLVALDIEARHPACSLQSRNDHYM